MTQQGAVALGTALPPVSAGHGRVVVSRAPGTGSRAWTIRVDADTRQRVRAGQQAYIDVSSGHYTVDARTGWSGSDEVGVDVFAGSVVQLLVEPSATSVAAVLRALTPRGALRLSLVEPPTSYRPVSD